MKKIIMALAIVALAFAAQADLVTTFPSSSTAVGSTMDNSKLNNGWYTNNVTAQNWDISGGVASRNDLGANAYAGLGQLFTFAGSGAATLNINVDVVDADSDLDWSVYLIGYDQTGVSSNLLTADTLNISNNNLVNGGGNYAVTQLFFGYLGTFDNIGSSSGNLLSTAITLDSGYEFYGIRIGAKSPDVADSFVINSVNIVVPEPATVGMLGLGAVVALIARRIRR